MITQRLTADQGTMVARLVIETNPEDANSYAELLSLQEELKLRINVKTEGSIITTPPPEDVPPPPTE
jgi:hypothetical protein